VRSIQIIPVRRPARGQSATSPFVIVSGFAECLSLLGRVDEISIIGLCSGISSSGRIGLLIGAT
jgi:hypothetical protein